MLGTGIVKKLQTMWHQETINAFNVVLKPVTIDDLELLREWRNRPDIRQCMFEQNEISSVQQRHWFSKVSVDKTQLQFVICYKEKRIGACNLKSSNSVAIDACISAESGMYIADNKYRGTILAFFAALALNEFAFLSLSLRAIVAKVKSSNVGALRFNEQLGYVTDSHQSSENVVCLTLNADAHQRAVKNFARFIRN